MAKFMVELSALATVRCSFEIEALDREAAEAEATLLADEGEAIWKYDGAQDGTVEIESVSVIA